MKVSHEFQLQEGIWMCLDEGCNADECCDENRCSSECICNSRPDEDLTNALHGKTIYQALASLVPGAWGAEPATVLEFTDGTRYTFVHPVDDDE